MKEKVIISGIGVYCPIGKNVDALNDALISAHHGFEEVTEFDTSTYRNTHAGVVRDFDENGSKTGVRSNLLIRPSVEQALKDSGLLESNIDRSRISISIGTSIAGYGGFVDSLFKEDSAKRNEDYPSSLNRKISLNHDETILNIPGPLLATEIAREYGISGVLSSSVTACSASGNAMALAVDTIRSGLADAVIVASVDPLSELTYMGFHTIRAMSQKMPKPLDKNRDGLLIGEGSACFILERESYLLERGGKRYAEIAGYGLSNDAYHATQPHPNGEGAVVAMKEALREAGVLPEDIQYINMHGTGTKHNDNAELKAIQRIFKESLKDIPISSSKSLLGHALGAAGSIEGVICVTAMNQGFIPPSINFEEPIEGIDYQVATKETDHKELNLVMNNSFGFGGNGASFIFKK